MRNDALVPAGEGTRISATVSLDLRVRYPVVMRMIIIALALMLAPSLAGAKTPWPGKAWTTAKAFHFNWIPYGPPALDLHVYEPSRGMHPNIRTSHPLTKTQAGEALLLVKRTQGEALVSGCPFPRHGVIFYDAKGKPVGSVSVCFSCGDVMVWPNYGKPSRKEKKPRKKKTSGEYTKTFMKRYDAAMVRWHSFFAALPDMPEWNRKPRNETPTRGPSQSP